MRKQLLLFIVLVLAVAACENSDRQAMEAITSSLERTNAWATNKKDFSYGVLKQKLKDRTQRSKAAIWFPKALQIEELSVDLLAYIDTLQQKIQLSGGSGSRITRILKEEGAPLYDKLLAYYKAVPAVIDTNEFAGNPNMIAWLNKDVSNLKKEMILRLGLDTDSVSEDPIGARQWLDNHLVDLTPSLATMMLYKLKNDIMSIENVMVEYFNNHSVVNFCGIYKRYSFLGVISSGQVKAGQAIEIMAGRASFNVDPDPSIIIYDSCLAIGPEGTAIYRFKARGKPGKYNIPVNISYTEQDGRPVTVTKQLEYIIAP